MRSKHSRRVGEFKRAKALLDRYLRVHSDDSGAHLLMAQFATEPADARPELALRHLRAVRPGTNKQAARVKFFEGKAQYQQQRFDLAESCWRKALELDPTVPEAGWAIVDLLDKESRREEAHRLAMKVHEVEPDPRDRVRILLEMCRIDIETPDPLMQVLLFEPLVKEHPEHLPLCITLGQAPIRVNRSDEGLKILGDALKRHPDSPEAWDASFTALFNASQVERLAAEFTRLPPPLAGDARFAKHDAMIAQNVRDWPRARAAYRRAFEFEPFNDGVCYRYRFVFGRWATTRNTLESTASTRISNPPTCRCAGLTPAPTEPMMFPSRTPAGRRTGAESITKCSRSKRSASGHIGSCTSIWRLFEKKWAGPTKRAPGIAWCCATHPATHSAWRRSRVSGNMEPSVGATSALPPSSRAIHLS